MISSRPLSILRMPWKRWTMKKMRMRTWHEQHCILFQPSKKKFSPCCIGSAHQIFFVLHWMDDLALQPLYEHTDCIELAFKGHWLDDCVCIEPEHHSGGNLIPPSCILVKRTFFPVRTPLCTLFVFIPPAVATH